MEFSISTIITLRKNNGLTFDLDLAEAQQVRDYLNEFLAPPKTGMPQIHLDPSMDPGTWTVSTRPWTEEEKKVLDLYKATQPITLEKESGERCANNFTDPLCACHYCRRNFV